MKKLVEVQHITFDLKMRFTTFLLLITLFQTHANTNSQNTRITLNMTRVSVQEVLNKIESLTEYKFFVNTQKIDVQRIVTVKENRKRVLKILEKIFLGTEVTYKVFNKQIILKKGEVLNKESSLKASNTDINKLQQQQQITGVITNTDGQPLPGVTILEKGTTHGTLSDFDGKFSLKVTDKNAILVISYIGLETQEIQVKKETTFIKVKMASSVENLKEVEVFTTGYTKVAKEKATGSFTQIKVKAIQNKVAASSIISRLEGLVPGFAIIGRGGSLDFRIRGQTTLSYGNKYASPLIVVDGFPLNERPINLFATDDVYNDIGKLLNLNPEDIEKIDILKDAAAAALWGAKASNGVIVITTKKGRKNQPLTVNFSSHIVISPYRSLSSNGFGDASARLELDKFQIENNWPISSRKRTEGQQIYLDLENGILSKQDAEKRLDILRKRSSVKELEKYFLKTGIRTQHSLSLSGGGTKDTYYFSLGFSSDAPFWIGNKSKEINLNIKNQYSISEKLQLRTNISGSFTKSTYNYTSKNVLGFLNSTPAYRQLIDDNGKEVRSFRSVNLHTYANLRDLESKGYYKFDRYLVEELNNSDKTHKDFNFRAITDLTYTIAKGLNINSGFQYEKGNHTGRDYYNENTFFTRDKINTYTSIDTDGKLVYGYPKGGILHVREGISDNYTWRNQLNFTKKWNDIHDFSLVLGGEIHQSKSTFFSKEFAGYDERTLTSKAVDRKSYVLSRYGYAFPIGDYYDLIQKSVQKSADVYSNLTYTYSNRYTFSGSLRVDNTSLIGQAKKKPLWSTGIKWNLFNEKFFTAPWIDRLSLRASYGLTGNINTSTSPFLIVQYQDGSFISEPKAAIINPENKNLRWEETQTVNIGIDFSMFHSRFSGAIDLYNKNTTDLLYNDQLNPTYGFSSVTKNAASLYNRGIELNLQGKIINTSFGWDTRFIFSYSKNKITKVYSPVQSVYTQLLEGKPYQSVFSYKWAGLSKTGEPQLYDKNGKIIGLSDIEKNSSHPFFSDSEGFVYHGSTIPKFTGSFTNTFSYHNFKLSALLIYQLGHVFRRRVDSYSSYPYGTIISNGEGFANRWQKPGDEKFTDVPGLPESASSLRRITRLYNGYTSNNVLNAGVVRLREINLSYSLPQNALHSVFLNSLQFNAQLRNVGFWAANKSHIDPSYNSGGLSPQRELTIGVRVSF